MKKIICIFLSLLFIASCVISAGAADTDTAETGKTIVTIGDWTYERISGGKYWEIDSYTGSNTELVIPRIVNDVMVVSLSNYCFNGNTSLKSVQTSSPLWNIGEYAFNGCTSLESVELNFALQTIGVGAFTGTHSLKNINLEDTVVTEIKAHTFSNSGIKTAALPDTCTRIGNLAFSQCTNLSKIEIPDSVTNIAENAFNGCNKLVIYAKKNSYAISYAKAHHIDYVIVDAYILGDFDNSGEVDIIDATWIQRFLAQISIPVDEEYYMQGDVDGSGELEITDVTFIMRYLAYFKVPYDIGKYVPVKHTYTG